MIKQVNVLNSLGERPTAEHNTVLDKKYIESKNLMYTITNEENRK